MLRLPSLLSVTLSLLVGARVTAQTPLSVWPLPAKMSSGDTTLTLSPDFQFKLASSASVPTLSEAFSRYSDLIFYHNVGGGGSNATKKSPLTLTELTVKVTDVNEKHPQLGTDESYTLMIPSDGTSPTLSSNTVYGALRGLETFSQLITFSFADEAYHIQSSPISISDLPRFKHRGLMIDSARHFLPLRFIYRMLDAMSYAKLNTMHWHMVDSQAFPFQSKTSPKLWDGAYSSSERYLQSDIAAVVEYARKRGIRVMVEFDMPGHGASWCTGYPEICPSASCLQPLNVASDSTWKVIEGLVGEVRDLFPESFVHLGGDEVDTSCWTNTPEINSWLKARNYTGNDGYLYFVNRTAATVRDLGKTAVQWVEVWDNFGTSLDKNTIVHVWKDKATVQNVTAHGYKAIYNPDFGDDSWYLDNVQVNWKKIYMNEPCENMTDTQCGFVLGGQGEMWGEKVDGSDFHNTVWPRLAAIAERLWSPYTSTSSVQTATPRLADYRCTLLRRGIAAAPISNSEARTSPSGPGSCYDQ